MAEIEFDEAIDFLMQHFKSELIETVCEAYPDEVKEYLK